MPGNTLFLFSCKVVFFEMSQIIIEENKGKLLGREKERNKRIFEKMPLGSQHVPALTAKLVRLESPLRADSPPL
jgi:hypothetical protein